MKMGDRFKAKRLHDNEGLEMNVTILFGYNSKEKK